MPAPHDLLGVPPTASADAIRRAFRRRAFEVHPDRNPAPTAADDFRLLREAYDAALASIPSEDGFDADRIAREIEQAAREAQRRRSAGGGSAPVWQQLRVTLDRTPRERLTDGLATPRGRTALLTSVGVGLLMAVALPLAAGVAAWSVVAGVLALAGSAALGLRAAYGADERPWAVDTHWRGVRDLRWDATVEWADIRAVREGDGWLDLLITDAAAARLVRTVPPQTLVRLRPTSSGDPGSGAGAGSAPQAHVVAYRLPLRASAGLAGMVRHHLAAGLAA